MEVPRTPTQVRRLDALEVELAAAKHGDKKRLVKRAAGELGVVPQTVYRWLKEREPASVTGTTTTTRKRRGDAGQRAITDEELKAISDALLASYRKTGKRILTFPGAVAMLRANGIVSSDLSPYHIARILTERGMHPAQLTRPSPAVEQRSLHPNHVWQVDASVCVAYYLSNATGLQVMLEEKFNKNKPRNLSRIAHERLIRYVVADHLSHAFLPRYYLGSECTASLCDFLIWCFAPKNVHPMHGVPFILQMDPGAANTSKPALKMLRRLQVEVMVHERHNSRANGSVEKAHDLIETHFESALRFGRVADLGDLNAKALAWAAHYGSHNVHTRHGKTRIDAWMSIEPEQLRLAPPVELMRTLPTTTTTTRRVDNNLHISFAVRGQGSREYDLRYLPGVMPGRKVEVEMNGLQAPAVQVRHPEQTGEGWTTVHPVERNEFGFRADAPVIGEELRTGATSIVDANRAAAWIRNFGGKDEDDAKRNAEKGALARGGKVKAFNPGPLPAFIRRPGAPLQVQASDVAAPRMSTVGAGKAVLEALRRIGRFDCWGPHVRELLIERWGDAGVPEDEIDSIVAEITGTAPAAAQALAGARPVEGRA